MGIAQEKGDCDGGSCVLLSSANKGNMNEEKPRTDDSVVDDVRGNHSPPWKVVRGLQCR